MQYIQLAGNQQNRGGLNLINRKLSSEASKALCKYLDSIDMLHQRVTFLSDRLVSFVEESYSARLGADRSCHCSSNVHRFDLPTGKEYFLADILGESSLSKLRSIMPASIAADRKRQEDAPAFKVSRELHYPATPH